MKNLFLISSLLFCATSFAIQKKYQVDLKVSINHQLISTPRIILFEGQTATLQTQNADGTLNLEIHATEHHRNNEPLVKLDIQIKTDSKQRHEIKSKMSVIAKENQLAQISSSDDLGKDMFEIEVLATPN